MGKKQRGQSRKEQSYDDFALDDKSDPVSAASPNLPASKPGTRNCFPY